MKPERFADDLSRIPETLDGLAAALETGLPHLDAVRALGERIAGAGGHPRVLLLGMGSSAYAADVVAREARQAGAFVTAELASARDLPAGGEADPLAKTHPLVVVAVSATGGSIEVLDAVSRFAGRVPLIAVTNRPGSALEEAADLTVPQLAGAEASGVACRSFRNTLVVLRAIVAELHPDAHPVRERLGGLAELARAGAAANAALLASGKEWLEPVAESLSAPLGTWVLAPVERLSSSRQSALMMREIPRRPAFASETGDWSHVDVYLTKTQDYRALIFAGSAWDAQALEWMTSRGSTWVSVGRSLSGSAAEVRYPGEDDPRVAQLAELLVAERVAAHWLAD